MYEKAFGLNRKPFEITADPYFLFPTAQHNEALASIYYGVQRHKGFVVLTGEVGTGKTLMVRCLLDLLHQQRVVFAYVFNTRLSPLEFLRYVTGDLGLASAGQDKSELLLALNHHLIARHNKGQTTVLVVDEAQHLTWDVLEEIRLLTNLETAQQKLLQILLVGQPELDEKLESADLRQLKQRIALRCRLEPLRKHETEAYILRRLRLAGANSHAGTLFPDQTMAAIYRYSRGVPRLINVLCDNALTIAYGRQLSCVVSTIIDEVSKDLRLTPLADSRRWSEQDSEYHPAGTPDSGDHEPASSLPQSVLER